MYFVACEYQIAEVEATRTSALWSLLVRLFVLRMKRCVVDRLVGVLMSIVGFEAPVRAARSALSYPAMTMWLGIQCRAISAPAFLSVAATWNVLV